MPDNILPFANPTRFEGKSARRLRPASAQAYRIKVSLEGVTPEIWREVEVDSTLTLKELHPILQIALGWTDSHLHQWETSERQPGAWIANERFTMDLPDLEEGGEATLEGDVHLDELLQTPGDRLWYDYDFGDDWLHVIELIAAQPGPPPSARVLAAENACPPEDIGGPHFYQNLLDLEAARRSPNPPGADDVDAWVAEVFAMQWPDGVIDQSVDIDAINATLATKPTSAVIEVHQPWRRTARPDFLEFLDRIRHKPEWSQTIALVEKACAAAKPVDPAMAEQATTDIRWLLDYVGGGLPLTAANYLKPVDVAVITDAWQLDRGWIGKSNRESDVFPLLDARKALQNAGLLRAAKGRLTRTKIGVKLTDDPLGLWSHLASKVPGRALDAERDACFAYFLALAAEVEEPDERAAQIMSAIGWRTTAGPYARLDLHRDAWAAQTLLTRLGGYEERRGIARLRITPIGVAFARSVVVGGDGGR